LKFQVNVDMFDPHNFNYNEYMLETYNLTEMPNKYYRGNYRCDDVILNAQDAVWVEEKCKEIGDYKLSSFTYRLFYNADGDNITYYLMDKDKPFISMEYSFIRISDPIKGIENKHLWNFKWDKGLARNFFDDYILKREPVIISDELLSERGFNFWKYLFSEHVRDGKTHKMYVININDGNVISIITEEDKMNEFYTDSKSGKFRFVLEKVE